MHVQEMTVPQAQEQLGIIEAKLRHPAFVNAGVRQKLALAHEDLCEHLMNMGIGADGEPYQ
jgi:hypothetical protein